MTTRYLDGVRYRSTFGQALVALVFNLGGLLSGSLAANLTPVFVKTPWMLVLFPMILTVRGNIGGILSGKLGTMLHSGQIEPKMRGNTRDFYTLLQSVLFLTFIDTLAIGLIAFVLNVAVSYATIGDLPLSAILPTLTCVIAVMVAIPITSTLAVRSFKGGLDPDVLVYPVTSTVNDILVTVTYAVLIYGATTERAFAAGMEIAFLLVAIMMGVVFLRQRRQRIFRNTLREGAPIVILSSLFGAFNGLVLGSIRELIARLPAILVVYPSLITSLGGIGSIIGSTTTTRLALGYFNTFREALRSAVTDLLAVESSAIIVHILIGIMGFFIATAQSINISMAPLVEVALISNLLSFLVISLISLAVAVASFRRGWDPDNLVIPIIASLSDATATLCLVVALAVVGFL